MVRTSREGGHTWCGGLFPRRCLIHLPARSQNSCMGDFKTSRVPVHILSVRGAHCFKTSASRISGRTYLNRSQNYRLLRLGGSCCARIPKIGRGSPETICFIHLGYRVARRSPGTVEIDRGCPNSRTEGGQTSTLMPPHIRLTSPDCSRVLIVRAPKKGPEF